MGVINRVQVVVLGVSVALRSAAQAVVSVFVLSRSRNENAGVSLFR